MRNYRNFLKNRIKNPEIRKIFGFFPGRSGSFFPDIFSRFFPDFFWPFFSIKSEKRSFGPEKIQKIQRSGSFFPDFLSVFLDDAELPFVVDGRRESFLLLLMAEEMGRL